jgi:hypothetical protein
VISLSNLEKRRLFQCNDPLCEKREPDPDFRAINFSITTGISSGLPGQELNVGQRRNIHNVTFPAPDEQNSESATNFFSAKEI